MSEESIMRIIMTDILTLKYKAIESQLISELNAIKSLSTEGSTRDTSQHIGRIQELNSMKRQIAELLGERVLMLMSK